MELFLHPPEAPERHRSAARGRLSTVGHAAAFRAFARVARDAGVRFMVIGGTFRDVAIRAASTRDIDVVLVDRVELPRAAMVRAGFRAVPGSRHAWRYRAARRSSVDLEVAASASSLEAAGPFSIAYQHSRRARIEGMTVRAPQIDDFVILKLLAAAADIRRHHRDLADVHAALAADPDTAKTGALSVSRLRARLSELYGIGGSQLKDLVALLRLARRGLP